MINNQDDAFEIGDITVDEGSEIRSDMSFDKSGEYLYVMTKDKVKNYVK